LCVLIGFQAVASEKICEDTASHLNISLSDSGENLLKVVENINIISEPQINEICAHARSKAKDQNGNYNFEEYILKISQSTDAADKNAAIKTFWDEHGDKLNCPRRIPYPTGHVLKTIAYNEFWGLLHSLLVSAKCNPNIIVGEKQTVLDYIDELIEEEHYDENDLNYVEFMKKELRKIGAKKFSEL
jgi:hypothetical protein